MTHTFDLRRHFRQRILLQQAARFIWRGGRAYQFGDFGSDGRRVFKPLRLLGEFTARPSLIVLGVDRDVGLPICSLQLHHEIQVSILLRGGPAREVGGL